MQPSFPGQVADLLNQGLAGLSTSSAPSVMILIGFPLLLLLAAWKVPGCTRSASFLRSGMCIAGYYGIAGVLTWSATFSPRIDASTVGFLSMLQNLLLGAAVLFFTRSLAARHPGSPP